MSASFTNQVLAQSELHQNAGKYDRKVDVLPKHLDEKVARPHLDKLGVRLIELSKAQADYVGVPIEGPYKPEHTGARRGAGRRGLDIGKILR